MNSVFTQVGMTAPRSMPTYIVTFFQASILSKGHQWDDCAAHCTEERNAFKGSDTSRKLLEWSVYTLGSLSIRDPEGPDANGP